MLVIKVLDGNTISLEDSEYEGYLKLQGELDSITIQDCISLWKEN